MARKKAPEVKEQVIPPFETFDPKDLLRRHEHKYLLVNLLAGRAFELKKGARATVEIQGLHTNLELAHAEAVAGHLRIKKKEEELKVVSLID